MTDAELCAIDEWLFHGWRYRGLCFLSRVVLWPIVTVLRVVEDLEEWEQRLRDSGD